MLRRTALLAALACLISVVALAQVAPYPREVEAVLADARKECSDQGASEVKLPATAVRKLDLTGDGRDGYIVDMNEAECVGSPAVYCGTGGCNLTILVARRDGSYKTVFDDRVRGYEIKGARGARTIRFALHGGYCGGHGNPSCYKERRVTGKPFRFAMRQ